MRSLAFSRPDLLWTLLAALLPLLIHLLNRHRTRRQPFAAMEFLLRVQRQSRRRLLLRQLLLLLLRTVVIAALALAAAGPRLVAGRQAPRSGLRQTVLVLDLSLSMRSRLERHECFQQALRRARRYLRQAGPGERFCLLGAGQDIEVLATPCNERAAPLLDRLSGLRPGWGTSDLSAAALRAVELLGQQAPAGRRRVILLSDAAAHAFPEPLPADSLAGVELVVDAVCGTDTRDNLAVAAAGVHQQGQAIAVEAAVRLYGEQRHQTRLTIATLPDERVLASGFVSLAGNSQGSKRFSLRAGPAPRLAEVSLEAADALAADDRRQVLLPGHRSARLLLVDGQMSPLPLRDELFYLENALSQAQASAAGLSYRVITPERLGREKLSSTEVVVLANCAAPGPAALASLRAFVAGGGGLLLTAGEHTDIDASNRLLGELLPWPLRDVVPLGDNRPGQQPEGLVLGRVDTSHPVLQAFGPEQIAALRRVRTWRAVALEPGRARPGSRVLLEYENGTPALVEGRYRRGRVVLLTSTLDRDWNNWPTRGSYLPFFQRLLAYLSGRLERRPPPEVAVGEPVELPRDGEATRLELRAPDGSSRSVDLGAGTTADFPAVRFGGTLLPGWWSIRARSGSGAEVTYPFPGFFVRLPPGESDLQVIATDKLRARLGSQARLLTAGDEQDRSRRLDWLMLLLAAAAVLAESFLVRR